MDEKKAFVVELNNAPEYQRLLPGPPQTHGMKSGKVFVKPNADCGEHSTEDKEEQLVFLAGKGIAFIGDQQFDVGAGKVCYIPPQTVHNIKNTSPDEPLIYIFCVAPAH